METKTSSETKKNNRVINLIILDESGSMASIYHAALNGINSTIENIKSQQVECPEIEQRISIVTFNTDGIKLRLRNASAIEARQFSSRDFQPSGCTPLYDAMGRSLVTLEPHITYNDAVVVTVITDGYENASTVFSGANIKALVDRLTQKGWLFTYIGANQDSKRVGLDLGIRMTLDFDANEESTEIAYAKMAESHRSLNKRLRREREKEDFDMRSFMAKETSADENYFER